LVAEADESDRSFLKLFPTIAVITNIDHEHLESYGSFGNLQQAFVEFANKVPFYGSVVCSADDANLAEVVPRMTRRVITYGFAPGSADLTATNVALAPMKAAATVCRRRMDDRMRLDELGGLELNVPGRHNLSNALAAVAVGMELGLTFEEVAAGLRSFHGAERRFEVRGEPNGILIVDDYGHHPTEIEAVLTAAKPLNRRIVVAFQPHRFSRTKALRGKFGSALALADHVVLTDIYAAGEDPIPGISLDSLAEEVRGAARGRVDVVPNLADVPAALARLARPGDVVVTLGAGSIGGVAERLIHLLTDGSRLPAPEGARR
jgi:UDP-N-acetylmuramate--alanine ligase